MTKNLSDLILEPIITEKSTSLSKNKKYTFKVSKDATKSEIKNAFCTIFPKRKVLNIKSLVIKGHTKRTKSGIKLPRDGKKAIITVEGPPVEYFPEVS